MPNLCFNSCALRHQGATQPLLVQSLDIKELSIWPNFLKLNKSDVVFTQDREIADSLLHKLLVFKIIPLLKNTLINCFAGQSVLADQIIELCNYLSYNICLPINYISEKVWIELPADSSARIAPVIMLRIQLKNIAIPYHVQVFVEYLSIEVVLDNLLLKDYVKQLIIQKKQPDICHYFISNKSQVFIQKLLAHLFIDINLIISLIDKIMNVVGADLTEELLPQLKEGLIVSRLLLGVIIN